MKFHFRKLEEVESIGGSFLKIKKLLLVTGTFTAVFAAAVLVGIVFLQSRQVEQRRAFEEQLEFFELSHSLNAASDYLTQEARYYVQTGDKKHFDNYWREVNETRRREKAIERLKELGTPVQYLSLLEKSASESSNLAKLEDVAMKALEDGKREEAQRLLFGPDYDKSKDIIGGYVGEFQKAIREQQAKRVEGISRVFSRDLKLMIAGTVLLIFVILGTFVVLYRRLSRIGRLMDDLSQSAGDLTQRLKVSGSDEVAEIASHVDSFIETVQEIVVEIAHAVASLTASAEELSATSTQTADVAVGLDKSLGKVKEAALAQARDAESGASNIKVLGDLIDEDLRRVAALGEDAGKVTALVSEGIEALNKLNASASESTALSKKVYEAITETSVSVSAISKASEMVRGIAHQINLLALNAAIESARAGEAGKGFSVVAEEVRKLAEETSSFTDEITRTIGGLLGRAQEAVELIQQTQALVEIQNGHIRNTNDRFDGISNAINSVIQTSKALNESGLKMNDKKAQVVDIISSLSQLSDDNAAITLKATEAIKEQTASIDVLSKATHEVAVMSERIMETITRFKY